MAAVQVGRETRVDVREDVNEKIRRCPAIVTGSLQLHPMQCGGSGVLGWLASGEEKWKGTRRRGNVVPATRA